MNESVLEESELVSPDELIQHLLQDLITDAGPDDLANEFVNDFVLNDRPETGQVLAMFDTPAETLVEVLKGVVQQSYHVQLDALDRKGALFIDGLKIAVREKMAEMADDATQKF
ncbi:MAG: hypothetical protein AB7F88_07200 [Pyrinomonadaceae bacterium]